MVSTIERIKPGLLRLAPVLFGVMTPFGVSAVELTPDAMGRYAPGTTRFEYVSSVSQFADVQPTDWAYQALSNLIERYGCVAGYANGTMRGERALTP